MGAIPKYQSRVKSKRDFICAADQFKPRRGEQEPADFYRTLEAPLPVAVAHAKLILEGHSRVRCQQFIYLFIGRLAEKQKTITVFFPVSEKSFATEGQVGKIALEAVDTQHGVRQKGNVGRLIQGYALRRYQLMPGLELCSFSRFF